MLNNLLQTANSLRMLRLILFMLVITLSFAACGDDTPDCTTETIVGTYSGTTECDDTGSTGVDLPDGPTTYTIESVAGNNYKITDQGGNETLAVITGCDVNVPEVEIEFFGIMIKTSGSGKIDGDQLNLTLITEVDGDAFSCSAVTTKQ